jgi:hypothetical protein
VISSTIEKALAACLAEPIETRLKLLGDTINAVEKHDLKATNRLCGRLTSVIASLKNDVSASSEQLSKVAGYAVRVRAFNPRRIGKQREGRLRSPQHEDWLREQTEKKISETPVSDGFVPGFLDAAEAIANVRLKYSQQPKWTAIENEKLIQIALGAVPISEHSVRQLWLALAYSYKKNLQDGGILLDSIPTVQRIGTPEHAVRWVTAAICQYVNFRGIQLPAPNCLNFIEEIGFRT